MTRVYLPPDANTLLVGRRPVPALDRLHQRHRRRQAEAPAVHHHRRGDRALRQGHRHLGRASNDEGEEPDVVMASCGDVATQEALAATAILRERLPDLKLRFVNVVDLFKMQPASEHPHGSTEREFDSLFTRRQADHLQLPRLSVADPQARLPLPQPRQPARARLQGEGQHQHAARARDPQPGRPLQPGDRRASTACRGCRREPRTSRRR